MKKLYVYIGNAMDFYYLGSNDPRDPTATTYTVESDEFGCPVKVTVYKDGGTITYRGTFAIREDS